MYNNGDSDRSNGNGNGNGNGRRFADCTGAHGYQSHSVGRPDGGHLSKTDDNILVKCRLCQKEFWLGGGKLHQVHSCTCGKVTQSPDVVRNGDRFEYAHAGCQGIAVLGTQSLIGSLR